MTPGMEAALMVLVTEHVRPDAAGGVGNPLPEPQPRKETEHGPR